MIERISAFWLNRILGIPASTPLSPAAMGSALRVAFCPSPEMSPRLERFTAALRDAFMGCGVTILDGSEACAPDGRIKAGTAVIAPGNFPDELLPINRVSTLYNNIIVGIYDQPPPVREGQTPQRTLDAVVGRLAWDMVHLLIYVTDEAWTICSMNGGVTTIDARMPEAGDVLGSLIPKLTAQVVPPRPDELEVRPGALDTSDAGFMKIAAEFVECGQIWARNSRFMSHTSRESLAYRNSFYRKIVARYLDDRSGMSYGFFARQLPVAPPPALIMESLCDWKEGDPTCLCPDTVPLIIAGRHMLVPLPDVRIITTRSGCRKTDIDGSHDLVEIGREQGRAYLSTPNGLPHELVSKPSFDTLTIIAHAVGNAMISSILQALDPQAEFPHALKQYGASMSHWHYYPENDMVPEGFIVHGRNNPPVSCSTPQSAAYSLLGKLNALEQALGDGIGYLGDVHIEPGHGTNMVGTMPLAETAAALNWRECGVLACPG
ncbi:MAG: hypothetical protein HGB22_06510 [Chlorobiaceae bacterium]|nr:hypothetical protein [Chlorobiaceae bacterium]